MPLSFGSLVFYAYLCGIIAYYGIQYMKRQLPLLVTVALVVATALPSCTEKKKNDGIIIAPKPVQEKPRKTQRMSGYEQSRDVEWLGSVYKVVMKREADTSLPLAESDDHTRYFDNRITIRVVRKDGSTFFDRTFRKADFTAFLDEDTRKTGALLGLVFVEAKGDYLVFAGSVGSPDVMSDEYVPLLVKVSRMGAVSIAMDTQLDTGGEEDKPQSKSQNKKSQAEDDDDEDGV